MLDSSRSYAGSLTLGAATNLDLNGQALTLTGTDALDGMIQGAGSVTIGASADANGLVVYGGAALNAGGIITQDGGVTLGSGADTALLDVATTGTYDIIADVDLDENGNAIVNNAGVFEKTASSATSTIEPTVSNTGTITVASGTLAFAGSLVDDGLISVADGEVIVEQALGADSNQSGTITIGSSGEVVLQSSASSSQAIAFTSDGGVLALAQPTQIGGTIGGFQQGDTIDLIGATFTPGADVVSFSGQVLTVMDGGTTIAQLTMAGNYSTPEFQLTDDGDHGTEITVNIPCFVSGARILTPRGEVPVERLREGEEVLTHSGHARPIVWVGRRRIVCGRHAAPHKVHPVCIRAGAFAASVPRRDLLLSPDHAVFVDGVLIPVKHLINGITIRQDFAAVVEYFHVELATHDVLLAEGLAVESYLDSGNRGEFANAPGPIALHPSFEAIGDLDRCTPLCISGPSLVAAKRVLLARLEQDGFATTTEPDLRLVADGWTVRPVAVCGCLHRFILPGRAGCVRIVSRSGIPAEVEAESEDGRRLGVAIQGVVLDGRLVALGDAALGAGFHGLERNDAAAWRWTDGSAELVLPNGRAGGTQPRLLELLVRATARSWLEPPCQAVHVA